MSLSSSFHSGSCAHIGLHRDDSYCFELNNAGVIQMLISFHTLTNTIVLNMNSFSFKIHLELFNAESCR